MVVCQVRDADLHMAQRVPLPLTVSCSCRIQIGFTFLVPAHLGSPGQRAIKRMCVCVVRYDFNSCLPIFPYTNRGEASPFPPLVALLVLEHFRPQN